MESRVSLHSTYGSACLKALSGLNKRVGVALHFLLTPLLFLPLPLPSMVGGWVEWNGSGKEKWGGHLPSSFDLQECLLQALLGLKCRLWCTFDSIPSLRHSSSSSALYG